MKIKTRDITLCALFIALTTLGARLSFPLPFGNYYSMQFLVVILSGLILGPRIGALSMALYVILGLVGFPFFAAGGGFAYVIKPTFGFLLGFIPTSLVVGAIARRWKNPKFWGYLAATLGGLVVTYGFGILYMYVANNFFLGIPVSLWMIFLSCFPIEIPFDFVTCIIVALLAPRLWGLLRKEMSV